MPRHGPEPPHRVSPRPRCSPQSVSSLRAPRSRAAATRHRHGEPFVGVMGRRTARRVRGGSALARFGLQDGAAPLGCESLRQPPSGRGRLARPAVTGRGLIRSEEAPWNDEPTVMSSSHRSVPGAAHSVQVIASRATSSAADSPASIVTTWSRSRSGGPDAAPANLRNRSRPASRYSPRRSTRPSV